VRPLSASAFPTEQRNDIGRLIGEVHQKQAAARRRPLSAELALAAGRKMEGIPIDRDLAIADPEEA